MVGALIPGLPATAAPLPADYWQLPVPLQGEAPPVWPPDEQSLRPEACGGCHREHYDEWRSSRHAGAFSSGLVGQVLNLSADDAAGCLSCHAPLSEQQQAFFDPRRTADDPKLVPAGSGIACASCHIRAHRRYGPMPADNAPAPQPDGPHGGATISDDFEKSEFCGACHQFDAATAVNGKPLQNTLAEWRASLFATAQQTCQTCHMPTRRHLWRGIHDPEMVAGGLEAKTNATAEELRFTLRNSGVGHMFPTYVPPRVVLRAIALDKGGNPVPDTAVEYAVQRRVEYTANGWVEASDTRLAPGQTATLVLPWQAYSAARVWVDIDPDDYYRRQLFPQLLAALPAGSAAARHLTAAVGAASNSSYRLFEATIDRPR